MASYKIVELKSFVKKIEKKEYKKVYHKVKTYVYPIIRRNPYFGPNIKRLKGELSEFYRYRVGNYRLFYTIDGSEILVFIVDIEHRKDAYKQY